MDQTLHGIVRGKLITRGRQLLADRTGARPSPRRSERFDHLTPSEAAALDSGDIALLARVRRALADMASSVSGICRKCGLTLPPEQVLESPELSWCSHCARPNAD